MKVQRSLESYSCMTIEDQLSHRVFHLQRREQCLGDAEGTAGEILHTPEPELMQSVGNPTGLILRCAGKAGNPFQTTQGLIPSAQRFVWAAKQPLGNAALGALFA